MRAFAVADPATDEGDFREPAGGDLVDVKLYLILIDAAGSSRSVAENEFRERT